MKLRKVAKNENENDVDDASQSASGASKVWSAIKSYSQKPQFPPKNFILF